MVRCVYLSDGEIGIVLDETLKLAYKMKGNGVFGYWKDNYAYPKYKGSELYDFLKQNTDYENFYVDIARLMPNEFIKKEYTNFLIYIQNKGKGICKILIVNKENTELLFNIEADVVNNFEVK